MVLQCLYDTDKCHVGSHTGQNSMICRASFQKKHRCWKHDGIKAWNTNTLQMVQTLWQNWNHFIWCPIIWQLVCLVNVKALIWDWVQALGDDFIFVFTVAPWHLTTTGKPPAGGQLEVCLQIFQKILWKNWMLTRWSLQEVNTIQGGSVNTTKTPKCLGIPCNITIRHKFMHNNEISIFHSPIKSWQKFLFLQIIQVTHLHLLIWYTDLFLWGFPCRIIFWGSERRRSIWNTRRNF